MNLNRAGQIIGPLFYLSTLSFGGGSRFEFEAPPDDVASTRKNSPGCFICDTGICRTVTLLKYYSWAKLWLRDKFEEWTQGWRGNMGWLFSSPWRVARVLAVGIAIAASGGNAWAQLKPASPPIADPNDKRFVGVTEDWTTPSLESSHLRPVQPLFFVDDSHPDYTVYLIHLQWRWGDPLDVYLIRPNGAKNPPVILNLYSYPEGLDAYKNEVFQQALIKGGFAAVGFVSALTDHRYHDRPMREWFISELQECLGTSAHDVQMLLNYLTWRGDLDMTRVGMYGQGSGGAIGILASAVDPRIKVLDVLDPWGDWPDFMATSPFVPDEERAAYVKPDYLKKVATVETTTWLPKIQAKKFRLQQNIFSTYTPLAVKEKVRAAVPPGTTFAFYQTLPDYMAVFGKVSTNLDWVKHELTMLPEADMKPPAAPATSSTK